MFPLRDDNPTRRISVATPALIAACVAAWVLVQGYGQHKQLLESICSFGLIPGELLGEVPAGHRVNLGPGAVCLIEGRSWFTPLSSMFMHGSWFHLIGNLWFLWVFGNNVEEAMGRMRYVIFYLVCGLVAAAAQVAANPASHVPMVGASGAIGGVMGAYAILYPRAHVYTLLALGVIWRVVRVPAILMLGYWFVIQLLGGLPALSRGIEGGIAFWAHIGGFVAGAILARPLRRRH